MPEEQFEFNFDPGNPEVKKPKVLPLSEKEQKPKESSTDYKIRLLQMLEQELTGEIVFEKSKPKIIIDERSAAPSKTLGGITFKEITPNEQAVIDTMKKRKDFDY